jgi:alpha-methylacyl-CoA racemase
VLAPHEVLSDPHLRARKVFTGADGLAHPAPAPRFSRTPGTRRTTAPLVGEHTEAVLAEFGLSLSAVAGLRKSGAVGQA